MKLLPNIISALRILGALALLFTEVRSEAFWVIYFACGISDMLDGFFARKLGCVTQTGAMLDSVGDLVFVGCCCYTLFPVLSFPTWLWGWGGVIALIKLITQIVALAKYKKFYFPHTIANKATGFLLFITIPLSFLSIIPIAIVAGAATYAAIEEGYWVYSGKEV